MSQMLKIQESSVRFRASIRCQCTAGGLMLRYLNLEGSTGPWPKCTVLHISLTPIKPQLLSQTTGRSACCISYRIQLCPPGGSDGQESTCNAGDLGSSPRLGKSPGEGNGYPLQHSWGEFHGQRSLVDYSPWGHKESDTTK